MEDFSLLIALVVGIVMIIAQFQLFAIKRYLHDLLQVQLLAHGIIDEARFYEVAQPRPLEPLPVTVDQSKTTGA